MRPVEQVSWDDCQEFLERLNASAEMKTTGLRFALPTEAQWEYACRAGTTGSFSGELGDMGWYWDNSGGGTHPVAQKRPNAWGLYDMLGNVWERCADWYGGYPSGAVTDPIGSASGSHRVNRGGSWSSDACYCRPAYRNMYLPGIRVNSLGLRVALLPVQ